MEIIKTMKKPIKNESDLMIFQEMVWKNIEEQLKIENEIVRSMTAQNLNVISDIVQLIIHFDKKFNWNSKEKIEDMRESLLIYVKERLQTDSYIQKILIK